MSYPNYSRAERIADGIVHVLGITAAITGVVVLFGMASQHLNGPRFTATMIYALALVLMLGASGTYHILADTSARPLLRRIDHAAIYLKIAGTVTPLAVLLNTNFAYAVLTLVWAWALFGAAAKLRTERDKMHSCWLPYFCLACVAVALFVPLSFRLSPESLTMLALGGSLYLVGIVFYSWESLRYAMAIWHVFVLLATGACFLGISTALTQAG